MKWLFYIFVVGISAVANGQQARLSLDTNQLRIGEQALMRIQFEYQNPQGNALIIWPQYDDNLTQDVEIVDRTIDVERLVDSASSTYLREQQLLITAFEPGLYNIPSQEIRLDDSVFATNGVQLLIETVEVDTSKGITDIKPIFTVEYPFSERAKDWLAENWHWLAIIAGLILLFFGWKRYQKYQAEKEDEPEPEIIIPAHISALEKLNLLLQNEEWKSTDKKAYYSELTDTVRTYLEKRFDIHAMEQTTREIINDLKYASISEEDKVYLRKILREADMVKFAKFLPGDEDAYAYLNTSIDFVERTKENDTDSEH